MQIDIAAHIEKLLFLHDTLTIPSFGGFTATRAPATVDYAGGAVAPPSKTLTFSENLAVDDGILADDISRSHGIPVEDARAAIQEFVNQIQAQLNLREIVTLPGVGRLYKNYVQKIQFLPDATNFHAGSYGLPPLQFSPIARSREVTDKPAAAPLNQNGSSGSAPAPAKAAAPPVIPPLPPAPNFVSEPYTAPRTSGAQFGTGIGIGLLVCALAFGLWYWQHKNARNTPQPDTALQAEQESTDVAPMPGLNGIGKLADKPRNNDTGAVQTKPEREDEDLNDEVDQAAAKKVEILRRQNEAPQSANPDHDTRKNTCVLIIATLQDRNNADRLVAKLKGAGYTVYYREQRGHQVGIQFEYADPQQIDQTKAELIRFTGEKGIFVKKK